MHKGTAIVTGASSGIGAELARVFAKNGFDLVITARRKNLLQALAAELSAYASIHLVACDLSTDEGIAQLMGETADLTINTLINNAGVAQSQPFIQQNQSDIDVMLNLNISALTKLTHAYLPGMIKKGTGRILNIASIASFHPVPSMAVYAASKAYVLSLTESLSEELRGSGVFVTALCPGFTRTEQLIQVQGDGFPTGLASDPKEIAQAGYAALMQQEVVRIPGIVNQAVLAWAKHQPRWVIRSIGGLMTWFHPNY